MGDGRHGNVGRHEGTSPRGDKVWRSYPGLTQGFMRLDGGEYSEVFDVERGLCLGCAFSPLLFNIFFPTVLGVILQLFAADAVVPARLRTMGERTVRTGCERRILGASSSC